MFCLLAYEVESYEFACTKIYTIVISSCLSNHTLHLPQRSLFVAHDD